VLAGEENSVSLSGCMTNPKYASGYMSDDIKGFLRRYEVAKNQEVLEYLKKWDLPSLITKVDPWVVPAEILVGRRA